MRAVSAKTKPIKGMLVHSVKLLQLARAGADKTTAPPA